MHALVAARKRQELAIARDHDMPERDRRCAAGKRQACEHVGAYPSVNFEDSVNRLRAPVRKQHQARHQQSNHSVG
jgi:hypothetical protein